jgi:hypothetical protein
VNQPGTWRKAVAHSVSFGCFVDPTPLILRYRVWRGAAAIQERRRVSPIRRAALKELASPNDAAIQATVRKPATNEP